MSDGLKPYWQNYIGGRWVDGSDSARIAVENPASGETLAEIARGTASDIDAAVAAARACVESRALIEPRPCVRGQWLVEMARRLRARADEFARLITLEQGKNISQAHMEVEDSARYLEYYGGLADKIEGRYIPLGDGYVDYVVPCPYGVSAQIVPWNYPLGMTTRSLAPALAAGNAVVVKSPELTPLNVALFFELCADLDLPAGALNLVCGHGFDAGAALASHADIDQIVFTGSVATGQSILRAAAESVLPCVMELGGKSAGLVCADANLDDVVESVRWGIFLNAGQACNAMSRLLVQRPIYEQLLARLQALVGEFTVGPGIDDHFATPVVSAGQCQRVAEYLRIGRAEGARLLVGGERIAALPGHFIAPTIFADVTPEMRIAREEIFGPVLSVIPFDSVDEAIAIANGSDYGLAAGVFTRDLDRALWTAERLQAGQVYVNEWFAGGVETPFGGFGKSGYGREKGQEALASYYQSKSVGIRRRGAR